MDVPTPCCSLCDTPFPSKITYKRTSLCTPLLGCKLPTSVLLSEFFECQLEPDVSKLFCHYCKVKILHLHRTRNDLRAAEAALRKRLGITGYIGKLSSETRKLRELCCPESEVPYQMQQRPVVMNEHISAAKLLMSLVSEATSPIQPDVTSTKMPEPNHVSTENQSVSQVIATIVKPTKDKSKNRPFKKRKQSDATSKCTQMPGQQSASDENQSVSQKQKQSDVTSTPMPGQQCASEENQSLSQVIAEFVTPTDKSKTRPRQKRKQSDVTSKCTQMPGQQSAYDENQLVSQKGQNELWTCASPQSVTSSRILWTTIVRRSTKQKQKQSDVTSTPMPGQQCAFKENQSVSHVSAESFLPTDKTEHQIFYKILKLSNGAHMLVKVGESADLNQPGAPPAEEILHLEDHSYSLTNQHFS